MRFLTTTRAGHAQVSWPISRLMELPLNPRPNVTRSLALCQALVEHELGNPGSGAPARAKSHPSRDDFLEDREGAPEAATFVQLRRGDELNAGDFREQIHRLGEDRLTQLGGCRMLELAQGAAAVVQPDAMWKVGPRSGSLSAPTNPITFAVSIGIHF
jgi:hypothetical protein